MFLSMIVCLMRSICWLYLHIIWILFFLIITYMEYIWFWCYIIGFSFFLIALLGVFILLYDHDLLSFWLTQTLSYQLFDIFYVIILLVILYNLLEFSLYYLIWTASMYVFKLTTIKAFNFDIYIDLRSLCWCRGCIWFTCSFAMFYLHQSRQHFC